MKESAVTECIWETIMEAAAVVAEIFSLDTEEVLTQISRDTEDLKL